MTKQSLIEEIFKKKSFLCVGLDVDLDKIPKHLLAFEDPIFEFNKRIIDATKDYAVAYKPNTAFYERYGIIGIQALEKTINYIPDNILKIVDAKRGDIGNTSHYYAEAYFNTMGCDALTVSPYMGRDSILPYLDYKNKFTIVLGLTSNEGSEDFQQLELNSGEQLYQAVVKNVCSWGSPNQVMFVVGATNGKNISKIRAIAPNYFFLVPGVGSQGGSLDDVVKYGWNKDCGLLVNSSRGIIYSDCSLDFENNVSKTAALLAKEMSNYF